MSLDIDGTVIRIITGNVWGGDEHKKQAWSFAHFQSLDHHSFLEDTEITFYHLLTKQSHLTRQNNPT